MVSMESGLDGRNNQVRMLWVYNTYFAVSMESGLDGRNNVVLPVIRRRLFSVSMESGLDGRNNQEVIPIQPLRILSQWSPA